MGKRNKNAYDLTPSQKKAIKLFNDWYENKGYREKPIFKIGGHGGTGKTVLINQIMDIHGLNETNCYVVAYTGQAVNVLRQRGVHAKTIHSTFMVPKMKPLKDEKGRKIVRDGIPIMVTKFVPLKSIPSSIRLIICDEYSFVPEEMEQLMLRYNCPILAVGDPFQLPPVVGRQCFEEEDLDAQLMEVMRQEADSEIVKLANHIRVGDRINYTDYGNQVYFCNPKSHIEDTFMTYRACFRHADVTITSTNKQRQIVTDLYREIILKTKSPYPIQGERIICRRNDWNLKIGDYPLTNGTIGTNLYDIPRSSIDRKAGIYTMDFRPSYIQNDYFDNLVCNYKFLQSPFGDKDITKYDVGHMMEFAHAITVHVAQGGQFGKVVFMDSYRKDQDYMARLRYTAVTRATEWLVYVLPFSDYERW